jgi:large subunit ribosomal protein L9
MMEVILLERVEKLGQIGDRVTVRPGFARNYLLPQRKALRATKANVEFFQRQRVHIEAVNLQKKQEAEQAATKIEGLSVILVRSAGDTGQLYGSVTGRDIAEAAAEAGVSFDRGQVRLDKPIKTLGLYPTRIALHPEVNVQITVNVARSLDEAAIQAARGGMVSAADLDAEEAAAEAAANAAAAAEDEVEA